MSARVQGFHYTLNNTCALDQRTDPRQINEIHHRALFEDTLSNIAL